MNDDNKIMNQCSNDNKDFLLAEYNSKWNYVIHTESMQIKYIQWYFAIVAGVLAVLFGKDFDIKEDVHSVPLLFLLVYSIFVKLKILFQKANLKTIRKRLEDIEVQNIDTAETQNDKKWFIKLLNSLSSVFMMIFLPVVLVGTGLLMLLSIQLPEYKVLLNYCSFIYPIFFTFWALRIMLKTADSEK